MPKTKKTRSETMIGNKNAVKPKWLYMHTIHGVPATYMPGEQIIYANGTRGGAGVLRLAKSLQQIKQERRLSLLWRKKQGFGADLGERYGYARISIEAFKSCA